MKEFKVSLRFILVLVNFSLAGCGSPENISSRPTSRNIEIVRQTTKNQYEYSEPRPSIKKSRLSNNSTPKVVHTHVAGIPHRLGKTANIGKLFFAGVVLKAKRESGNSHDTNAIKLFDGTKFIGYVAREDNTKVASHMDCGGGTKVVITSVNAADPWKGVRVEITLT